jgi:hypothetical protein
LIALEILSFGTILLSPVHAAPTNNVTVPKSSNAPPEAVMKKFYGYLQQYNLWLGDDRGACSYEVDPTAVKKDGDDRFFLAKNSRGRMGTACRGVLEFRIMQANCKTQKLYEFVRQQTGDPRLAGWDRYETTLYNPERASDTSRNQSAEALKAICTL